MAFSDVEDVVDNMIAAKRPISEITHYLQLKGMTPEQFRAGRDPSLFGQLKEIPKAFVPGAASLFTQAGKEVAGWLPESWGKPVEKGIESAQQWVEGLSPPAPGYEEGWGRQLGTGLGNVAGAVGIGMIPGVGEGAAITAGAGLFGLGGMQEAKERAKTSGATQDEQNMAEMLGVIPGVVGAILPVKLLKTFGKEALEGAVDRVNSALVGGGVGAATSAATSVANNLIAQQVYKPEQGFTEGVAGESATGFTVGAVAQTLLDMVTRGKAKLKTPTGEQAPPTEPGAPPQLHPNMEPGEQGELFPGAKPPERPPPAPPYTQQPDLPFDAGTVNENVWKELGVVAPKLRKTIFGKDLTDPTVREALEAHADTSTSERVRNNIETFLQKYYPETPGGQPTTPSAAATTANPEPIAAGDRAGVELPVQPDIATAQPVSPDAKTLERTEQPAGAGDAGKGAVPPAVEPTPTPPVPPAVEPTPTPPVPPAVKPTPAVRPMSPGFVPDMGANVKAAAAAREGNIKKFLTALSKSENPIVQHIAELARKIPGLKVNVDSEHINELGKITDRTLNGVSDPYAKQTTFHERGLETEETMAHEMSHAVLHDIVQNPSPLQQPHINRLKALHEHMLDKGAVASGEGVYHPDAGRNLTPDTFDEFLAEGETNPRFQRQLALTPYKNTTAWGKFTQAVAKLFGLKNDNAFTHFLSSVEALHATPGVPNTAKQASAIRQNMYGLAEARRTLTTLTMEEGTAEKGERSAKIDKFIQEKIDDAKKAVAQHEAFLKNNTKPEEFAALQRMSNENIVKIADRLMDEQQFLKQAAEKRPPQESMAQMKLRQLGSAMEMEEMRRSQAALIKQKLAVAGGSPDVGRMPKKKAEAVGTQERARETSLQDFKREQRAAAARDKQIQQWKKKLLSKWKGGGDSSSGTLLFHTVTTPNPVHDIKTEGPQRTFMDSVRSMVTNPASKASWLQRVRTQVASSTSYAEDLIGKKWQQGKAVYQDSLKRAAVLSGPDTTPIEHLVAKSHATAMSHDVAFHGGIAFDPATGVAQAVRTGNSLYDIAEDVSAAAKKERITPRRAHEMLQTAAYTKREESVLKNPDKNPDYHPTITDPQTMANGLHYYNNHQWIRDSIQKFQNYKNGLLKFLEQSGRYTPETIQALRETDFYAPFYRIIDHPEVGLDAWLAKNPGVKSPKQYINGMDARWLQDMPELVGADIAKRPIGDLFGNFERFTNWAVSGALANNAGWHLMKFLEATGEARPVRSEYEAQGQYVAVYDRGNLQGYKVNDPTLRYAFSGVEHVGGALTRIMTGMANMLRRGVTLMPGFNLAQVPMDTVRAMVLSGVKNPFALAAKSFKYFAIALKQASKVIPDNATISELRRAGLGSGLERGQLGESQVKRWLSGVEGPLSNSFKDRWDYAWNKLINHADNIARASDIAQRAAIYDQYMKEGATKAAALRAASEYYNPHRQGASGVITTLRQTVPFMNSWIQGMDLLYRSMHNKGLTSGERTEAYKVFWSNATKVMALSTLYTLMVKDDPDYQQAKDHERNASWIIPGTGGLKLPAPTDGVGFLFKVIPEVLVNYLTTTALDATSKAKRTLLESASNVGSPNILAPQALKPLIEGMANYSFFQGHPIVGEGLKNLPVEKQFTDNTSHLAIALGQAISTLTGGTIGSPQKLDYIIRGMTGMVGGAGLALTDALWESASSAPVRPTPVVGSLGAVLGERSFKLPKLGQGELEDYYDFRDAVQQVVGEFNHLKAERPEEAAQYAQENINKLQMGPVVAKLQQFETALRVWRKTIVNDKTMNADQKRAKMDQLDKLETDTLHNSGLAQFRAMSGR